MSVADRRFMKVVAVTWLVVCAAIVVTCVRSGLPAYADASVLALVVILVGLAATVLTFIVVAIPLRIFLNLTLKDRRRSHRTETIQLFIALALSIGLPLEMRRERHRLAPPTGVKPLSEFAKTAPPPRRLEIVRHDGDDYIAWFGALSGPIDVPSGPSCYLFDSKGALVDWQPETGDGGPVERFIRSSTRTGKISLEEALKLTQQSEAADGDDRR